MTGEPPYGQSENGNGGELTGAGKPRLADSGLSGGVTVQSSQYALPNREKNPPVSVDCSFNRWSEAEAFALSASVIGAEACVVTVWASRTAPQLMLRAAAREQVIATRVGALFEMRLICLISLHYIVLRRR